jgi:hypothetical protein
MRLSTFLFFLISVLSCNDSDDVSIPLALLHHDGNNGSAPVLNAGTNHVGVMFTGDQVAKYNQGELSEIQFFMANIPESCQLDIYQGSEDNHMPGTKIYSADLTSEITARTWNRHILDQALTIDSEDLWITLTFNHPASLGLIGCDLGPQVANGALILNASETSWVAYPFANINWNIRAGFIDVE